MRIFSLDINNRGRVLYRHVTRRIQYSGQPKPGKHTFRRDGIPALFLSTPTPYRFFPQPTRVHRQQTSYPGAGTRRLEKRLQTPVRGSRVARPRQRHGWDNDDHVKPEGRWETGKVGAMSAPDNSRSNAHVCGTSSQRRPMPWPGNPVLVPKSPGPLSASFGLGSPKAAVELAQMGQEI